MKIFFGFMAVVAIGCGLYAFLTEAAAVRNYVKINHIQQAWDSNQFPWQHPPRGEGDSLSECSRVVEQTLFEAHGIVVHYRDMHSLAVNVSVILFVVSIIGWRSVYKKQKGSNNPPPSPPPAPPR